jgi:phage/plasmid-associated DNA primase
MVVGKLVDELNEKHVRYLHCYKKIIIQRQNDSFGRMNQDATMEEIEAFSVKIHSDARKFMADNTPFISLGAAARGKIIDDLRSYSIHNEIKEMNCIPQYIPMKNKKYVDVFTGEIGDMEAHHYFTSCVNAEIIPTCGDTNKIDAWFSEIATGDKDKAVYLKRFAAYCFTFLVHDRMFVCLKGTGKNAKGAWKEFIMKISKGPEGMDSRAKNLLQNYWDKRGNANTSPENATPESYELLNKTFLYTDDMMPVPLDTNKIKRLVAGEDGSGRGLYGKPVDLHVLGKIVWTSNFDPDGPGEDNAYWERQVILPMLTKYVGPGETVDEKQYRFAQNHVAYMELLELRDAFFTIAVETLVQYYKALPWNAAKNAPSQLASFPLPASVIKYNQEARARQLPLAGFVKEYMRKELYAMHFCKVEDAFESYMIYLENVNETKAKKETTLTSFVKLLAIALDINVEGGYIQGRGMHKRIVSIKKKQFDERSYGPIPSSLTPSPFLPVDEFAEIDRAMSAALPPAS